MKKILQRKPKLQQKEQVEIISHRPQIEVLIEEIPQPEPRIKNFPVVKYDYNLPKISDEIEPEKQKTYKVVRAMPNCGLTRFELLQGQNIIYQQIQTDFCIH